MIAHKEITADGTTENSQIKISRPRWGVEKFTSVWNNISARSFNRLLRCRSSNLNVLGGTTKAMGSYGTVSSKQSQNW